MSVSVTDAVFYLLNSCYLIVIFYRIVNKKFGGMIVMTIGYIGSYTKHNGKGIYRYELDDVQGRIKF